MALVRRELSPAMPVQQVVYRRQGHATAKRGLQFGFDLRHHQDAAVAGTDTAGTVDAADLATA